MVGNVVHAWVVVVLKLPQNIARRIVARKLVLNFPIFSFGAGVPRSGIWGASFKADVPVSAELTLIPLSSYRKVIRAR